MQSSKLRKKNKFEDINFVPNQLLATDKTASQVWKIQFSQASELDFREIMQATRQII